MGMDMRMNILAKHKQRKRAESARDLVSACLYLSNDFLSKPIQHFVILDLVGKLHMSYTSRTNHFIKIISPVFPIVDNAGIALCLITTVAFSIESASRENADKTMAFLAQLIAASFKTHRTEISLTMAAKHIVVHDTRNTVFWFRLMLDTFINVGAGVTSRATFTRATHMVQASALSGHLVGVLLPWQSNLSGDNLEA
jgi:hypothetical protein